jgi:hypothetical protein
MISKDGAKTSRCQRLAPVRALRHEEQSGARRLGSLGEQICLDQTRDLDIKGNATFLGAFAHHPHPAGADVDVSDIEGEQLPGPQPGQQHQTS